MFKTITLQNTVVFAQNASISPVSQYSNIPGTAVLAKKSLVKAAGVSGKSHLLGGASVIGISVPRVLKDPGPLILRAVHMVTIVL